jgi:hypothetical protein
MSKKSKRQVRKETTLAGSGSVSSAAASASKPFQFNPDYTYVNKDLRRIGALWGSFLVILIALAIILR